MTDIEILQSLKAYTCKLEVIDRAIEALKAEPCVETLTSGYVQEIKYPCVDCISKAELVRKLNAWDHNVNAIPNYVWRVIRELPSVTPAPKIGRWEYNQYDGNPNIGNSRGVRGVRGGSGAA